MATEKQKTKPKHAVACDLEVVRMVNGKQFPGRCNADGRAVDIERVVGQDGVITYTCFYKCERGHQFMKSFQEEKK